VLVTRDGGPGLGEVTRRFGFDAADQLLWLQDEEGHTRRFRYDGAGRRIETQDPDAGTWRYLFDEASHEIARTDPRGGTLVRTYDGGGRITSEVYQDAQGGETTLATYHYRDAGCRPGTTPRPGEAGKRGAPQPASSPRRDRPPPGCSSFVSR